jgi:hypothetical protein
MKTKITDNGIIRNWPNQAPMIYYRKSTNGGTNWSVYTATTFSYHNNVDSFSFSISPSVNNTMVEYYFAAQDIALPLPKMATLPAGGSGINPPGSTAPPTRFMFTVGFLNIDPISAEIPKLFKLYNNYPNPFNPSTKLRFDIPKAGFTKLVVYDLLGRQSAVVLAQELKAGKYEIAFDGSALSSGVYFYKLVSGNFVDTKKMLLVK